MGVCNYELHIYATANTHKKQTREIVIRSAEQISELVLLVRTVMIARLSLLSQLSMLLPRFYFLN
jgi:hypothetical protein